MIFPGVWLMQVAGKRPLASSRLANPIRTWVRWFAPGAIWRNLCQECIVDFQSNPSNAGTKQLESQEFKMRRTSLTHPLQIATISAGPDFGRVGITFCPGKYDPDAVSGFWDRDLSIDLDAIRVWGAAAVVTLVHQHELCLLRVEQLGEEVTGRDMLWFHLPIVDVSIPDEKFEQQWAVAGDTLRNLLRSGCDVLVHCRGGLGRAGTIGARLLIELGMEPEAAIGQVRAARPGAIETPEQKQYVQGIARLA